MSHEELPTEQPAVVTVGLPYANGDLHVGHLLGYVTGDVYARGLRRIGQQTAFVCGSDMHGTPIAVNAAKQGRNPEELALEYHEQYEETFPEFNVEFDHYGHTHDETNTETTQEFVQTWLDEEYIVEKEIEVAWDAEADEALPDRFVEGTCPHCGEKARGDECDEGCQRHLEPGEIEDPVSVRTGNPAEYRKQPHKFLRLSDFQEYLQEFIDRLEGTEKASNQPREWIEGELQDLCITRDMDWGVDYPGDDREDLVLYVWVDAPIEYVSATKQYSEQVGTDVFDWEEVWKLDGETHPDTEWDVEWSDDNGEIIHVIGTDIIQHHCVYWPAMLRGAGYNEPRSVIATGFVGIDGKSLSTSRNRAIWAKEYLDTGFHPDLLRYYLTTGSGVESDIDFSWDRFAERVNGELVGNLGNFCYRGLLFANRNYDGTPDVDPSTEVQERIEDAIETFQTAVNESDVRTVGEVAIDLADFGNEYIQRNEPWNLISDDPEAAAVVIRDCVQLTKACAVLMQPIMPEKASALWDQLGEDGDVTAVGLEEALATPSDEFGDPSELFNQVEDETIEDLNQQLRERIEKTSKDEDDDSDDEETQMTEIDPIEDDRISFEQFKGIDMRVGEIVDAEPIEDADELVRLEVDIGVETRQVVAGLKQLHDVETLPETRVVLLANMEQAELFGFESNGMVLAAGDEADLLTTHEDAPLGTRIR
ncbi:methionine--tRNA ligase [Halovenus rubra]|uniref:Methionine--tRNA ligase n=2 Tax=Halovenus rubra TaxID=869890 RepID=A0ACC7E3D9_9EURY|nr:methionine--tRNA ligase [Halovenus rubra]